MNRTTAAPAVLLLHALVVRLIRQHVLVDDVDVDADDLRLVRWGTRGVEEPEDDLLELVRWRRCEVVVRDMTCWCWVYNMRCGHS